MDQRKEKKKKEKDTAIVKMFKRARMLKYKFRRVFFFFLLNPYNYSLCRRMDWRCDFSKSIFNLGIIECDAVPSLKTRRSPLNASPFLLLRSENASASRPWKRIKIAWCVGVGMRSNPTYCILFALMSLE